MEKIYFAALREGARIPAKRDEDAGYDVYACFEEPYFRFEPFETKLVPSGIISAFPPEYVAVLKAVSYTHLDVYKRQALNSSVIGNRGKKLLC